MDSSAATEELAAVREPCVQATALGSGREQCAACGSALASDQRYCVECGQRLGSARLPFMDDPARHSTQSVSAHPPRRRLSVNSTLIAGVGTLLLAMGIGILIGRSSPGSSPRSAPVQIVGASTAGAAPTVGTTAGAAETQASTAGGTSTPASGGSSSKSKTAAKAAKAKLPPPKVVTVGSPGKGKGYEKGHFTGNFFGKGEG